MSDFILIDKPKGITSFDVIRKLRKKLGIKKIGHGGTLDPNATGLLIIATETETKKLKDILGLPKIYEAEVLLGVQTTTGDIDGEVVEEKEIPNFTKEDIEKLLTEMKGELVLPVSAYSAMKQGGESLYKKARRGEKVVVPLRVMDIQKATLTSYTKDTLDIIFEVGSGTYIRSLAEELGKRLETVATLKNLRRVQIGDFKVTDAESI